MWRPVLDPCVSVYTRYHQVLAENAVVGQQRLEKALSVFVTPLQFERFGKGVTVVGVLDTLNISRRGKKVLTILYHPVLMADAQCASETEMCPC